MLSRSKRTNGSSLSCSRWVEAMFRLEEELTPNDDVPAIVTGTVQIAIA